MQDQATVTPNTSKQAEANINARIQELTNVNRIVTNAINLINEVEIKGGHAGPVAEILGWLAGFSKALTSQMTALQDTLPKPVVTESKVVEAVNAEVVA